MTTPTDLQKEKEQVDKEMKIRKTSCVMDKRRASDSKLVSGLLDEESKKLLIRNILQEIYGKHITALKRQEPYFYNAICEAIVLSYKLGIKKRGTNK